MRLNKYLALYAGLSRRSADEAIAAGRVLVNGKTAVLGYAVKSEDAVELIGAPRVQQADGAQGARENRSETYTSYVKRDSEQATPRSAASVGRVSGSARKPGDRVLSPRLDSRPITPDVKTLTIMLNKPVGYVVSRNGQGSKTIYDLLPPTYHNLKPVGRLDKNSSGLLLLTNDGDLAHRLTHPSFRKEKIYHVRLNRGLHPGDHEKITQHKVILDDGPSGFELHPLGDHDREWEVTMREGRNRQIRRTFDALHYEVTKLHRTQFGPYALSGLALEKFKEL